jgi:4-oxalocrotonate tautomerase
MPTLVLDLFKGHIKTDDQKRELVKRLTDAVVDTINVEPMQVRIRINENDKSMSARGGILRSDSDGQ